MLLKRQRSELIFLYLLNYFR